MTIQLLFEMFTTKKKQQREDVELSKESHKYPAALLTAFEQGETEVCSNTNQNAMPEAAAEGR